MRVLIIGAVSGNGGDAAILRAQVEAVRLAAAPDEVAFDVVDANPRMAMLVQPDLDRAVATVPPRAPGAPGRLRKVRALGRRVMTKIRRLRGQGRGSRPLRLVLPRTEVLDLYSDADVVLYAGGTSLVEHYSLDDKIAHLKTALVARVPLVLGTQSLGPFTREDHRTEIRHVVDRAASVLLRDAKSRAHLEQIGANTDRVHVLPDVVFALADPVSERRTSGGLRVAVSARAWAYFTTTSARAGRASYTEALRGAVTWLVRERQAHVTFLSTCQGVADYWIDDSAMAVEIVGGLPPDVQQHVDVRRDNVPPGELQRAYGDFDLVLATRMHAAILALNAGTPVVAIAYEFKTSELFAGMGLGHHVHDIEEVTAEVLIKSTSTVLDDLAGMRRVVAEQVLDRRDRALALGEHVVQAARRDTAVMRRTRT